MKPGMGDKRDMRTVPKVFSSIVFFLLRRGFLSIHTLPGCAEAKVDEHWWIAVNGHLEPVCCTKGGPPIPARTAYIEYDGWPAGMVTEFAGRIAAGNLANEGTLIAALEAATMRGAGRA